MPVFSINGTGALTQVPIAPSRPTSLSMPTGALGETFPRANNMGANVAVLTSQTVYMTSIDLYVGDTVGAITWLSATTALSAGVNQYAGLYNSARSRLAVSADGTNTAWGSNSEKKFTMTTPYVVTTSGMYYLALLINATVPSLHAISTGTGAFLNGIAPITCGTADTAQTSLPVSATTLTATASRPYAYITAA